MPTSLRIVHIASSSTRAIETSLRTLTFNERTPRRSFGFLPCVWLGIAGFSGAELRRIEGITGEHESRLMEIWDEYFDIGQ
jgi:hypothetical protein